MVDAAPWQIQFSEPPDRFVQVVQQAVRQTGSDSDGQRLAQLLWLRGLRDEAQVPGFLNPDRYQPASPFEFGEEMRWAVERLQRAIAAQEMVAIWGDFDADGVTATAVLWEGLGQFLAQHKTLLYYIPNRLTESHGLSHRGLTQLQQKGCRLIVTCDTGSTNEAELQQAQTLGIDVIVTDHHTLPAARPPVVAIVNPRSLPADHPLATLSGVAVAYKLVEALYLTLPDVPQTPLDTLLDLVAIGLIADLVELKGDCRYLAQRGIERLQTQSDPATATRPGVAKLLEFCKRSGDRPTDISFGLGPRINAVSRIQGDAHFCVELLTSQDQHLCAHLAEATELANARRKALQKDVLRHVRDRVTQLDLSTTQAIVLTDDQWQVGILGLVAGQIAQEYGRPTILLSTEGWLPMSGTVSPATSAPPDWRGHPFPIPTALPPAPLAKGSARSVADIDLYQLVQAQEHLLYRFGGHPFAAGLSLPVDNVPLFSDAINQQLRQAGDAAIAPPVMADLRVTVADLGKALFQELKLLEPCGMGNPAPRLLIQNCWFERVKHRKIKDRQNHKIEYIKAEFELWDESSRQGFPGVWWGHYANEIPGDRCDAIVELDFNANPSQRRYEIRLLALRPHADLVTVVPQTTDDAWILDWRDAVGHPAIADPMRDRHAPAPLVLDTAPTSWTELRLWLRRARQEQRPLAIAFAPSLDPDPIQRWRQLVGIAKYLSRTGQTATRHQLLDKLGISDRTLQQGFLSLTQLGFSVQSSDAGIQIAPPLTETPTPVLTAAMRQFVTAVKEEHFRRQYFAQLPLETLTAIAETFNLVSLNNTG